MITTIKEAAKVIEEQQATIQELEKRIKRLEDPTELAKLLSEVVSLRWGVEPNSKHLRLEV